MRDIRPRLMEIALTHPKLSPAQRVFLFMLLMLPAQYIDGKRRKGSRGMDARGYVALHYDYIAEHLHTSPENVKKTAQRLASAGFLSKVNPGTFGRPAKWQALLVRGDTKYRVTADRFVPPYGLGLPTTRGDTQSPLTYRAPDLPSHAPADGGPAPCPYHSIDGLPCPVDCRHYRPEAMEESA